jgi:hypothetical protein
MSSSVLSVCLSARFNSRTDGQIWMKSGVDFMLLDCTLKWYSPTVWGRDPWWGEAPKSDRCEMSRGPVWCDVGGDGYSGCIAGRKPLCEANTQEGAESPSGADNPTATRTSFWTEANGCGGTP